MAKIGAPTSGATEKEAITAGDFQLVTQEFRDGDVAVQMNHADDTKNVLKTNTSKFTLIKAIVDILLFCLKRCWLSCSAGVFVIFVIYWCYGSIVALMLCFFALSGLIYQVSDWLLYHPDQPANSRIFVPSPSMFGLPSESFFLKCADGTKIHATFVKQDSSIINQVPTILYLHGNAGNIGHRLANVQGLYLSCGFNVLLIEYRGYGHSEGSPSEEGLYLDAQAGLQFLLHSTCIDRSKIIVFGRSLGGAVAIDLASRPEFGKHILLLIVENTFTSIPEVAKVLFTWGLVKKLPNWFFKNQFLSLKKIMKISLPILFISGLADALIPPQMMKLLYQQAGSSLKRLVPFDSGTHNETWRCQDYYRTLNMFIDDQSFRTSEDENSCIFQNCQVMMGQDELRNSAWIMSSNEIHGVPY